MAKRIPQVDYFPTEAEIARMLQSSEWRPLFSRDYSSTKRNIEKTVERTEENTESIESLDARVDVIEAQIVVINKRLDDVEAVAYMAAIT